MTLTTDILRAWFMQFNADYFGDRLPMPRLALSKARTRLGTMSCKRVRRMGRTINTNFTIRISTYYDCTEREYQETLLHEMLHYHIVYWDIPDTSPHGVTFCTLMEKLNREHGWHITVSSSKRDYRVADTPDGSPAPTYVVLALLLRDGSRMLSVVSPRYAHKIDIQAQGTKEIADHRWYMTHDAFFSDFPKVRSLRARRVPTDVYNEKTAAMQPLVLKQ